MEDKKIERWEQLFKNLGYEIEKDNANMLILSKQLHANTRQVLNP